MTVPTVYRIVDLGLKQGGLTIQGTNNQVSGTQERRGTVCLGLTNKIQNSLEGLLQGAILNITQVWG